MRFSVVSVFSIALASCHPPGPELLLQGASPEPVIGSTGLANDLFIVVRVVPYGFQNLNGLVVAEDGAHERATFVAPAAIGLKKGDVIRASKICYRSDERPAPNVTHLITTACTDVVTPYAAPTPEAPLPPPPPTEEPKPQAPPNPQ
jgi:hypothetical protein